jgi:peroxin-5
MELFRLGQINEAVLAFEAQLQKSPDHDECWRMLGACHAENDEDKRAIECLRNALDCDPYNLDALLALGTSYVNEVDSVKALETLRSWVQHNPRFQGLKIEADEYSDGSLMDEVMQLMLAVSQWAPDDVDVLVVIGVLYNVSLDFESAAASFRKAISLRPDDYSLYNKVRLVWSGLV